VYLKVKSENMKLDCDSTRARLNLSGEMRVTRRSNGVIDVVFFDIAQTIRTLFDVRFWHLADNPIAPTFVRYWTKADKVGFWPGTVCPLMTLVV
jgi:hypothetical protein